MHLCVCLHTFIYLTYIYISLHTIHASYTQISVYLSIYHVCMIYALSAPYHSAPLLNIYIVYIRKYVYTATYACTRVRLHIRVHVYAYIYVYIYVYVIYALSAPPPPPPPAAAATLTRPSLFFVRFLFII